MVKDVSTSSNPLPASHPGLVPSFKARPRCFLSRPPYLRKARAVMHHQEMEELWCWVCSCSSRLRDSRTGRGKRPAEQLQAPQRQLSALWGRYYTLKSGYKSKNLSFKKTRFALLGVCAACLAVIESHLSFSSSLGFAAEDGLGWPSFELVSFLKKM